MSYPDTLGSLSFTRSRDSAFSYRCHGCNRCCHDKAIRVGPYEILRLARYLGLSTSAFLERHTEAGGTVLRVREDGACVFLTPEGCGVHADRPLACRLYPLARWIDPDGTEGFGELEPHPETAGRYGVEGTVGGYLEGQQVEPFFEAGERYGLLYRRMVELLERLDPAELDRRAERRGELDEAEPGLLGSPLVDVDLTVAEYCRLTGRAEPMDLAATITLHLEAIEAWLDRLGQDDAPETGQGIAPCPG